MNIIFHYTLGVDDNVNLDEMLEQFCSLMEAEDGSVVLEVLPKE